jgi:hypothetical protein
MKKHLQKKHTTKRHILKKGWIILGIIIFLWTAFWFVKVRILNQYQFVSNVIMLTIGMTLLINYALATAIYWAIKRLKKEWEIKQ